MKVPKYQVHQLNEYTYQFFSTGPRGHFQIIVSLDRMRENLYNLGFGVWNFAREELDDLMQLKNHDMDIILATVAGIALDFLNDHAGAWIVASGSTAARTRKYQIGIAKYLYAIELSHKVFGLVCYRDEHGCTVGEFPDWVGNWYVFESGTNYDAFLISRIH